MAEDQWSLAVAESIGWPREARKSMAYTIVTRERVV